MFTQRATKWFAKWTLRLLVTHTFVLIGTGLYLLFLFESTIAAIWEDIFAANSSFKFDVDRRITDIHWQASQLWFVTAIVALGATLLTPRTRLTRVPTAIIVAIVSAAAAIVVAMTQIEWAIVQAETSITRGYWRALFLDDTTHVLGNGMEISLNEQRWLFAAYVALSSISAIAVLALPRLLHRLPTRH